MKGLDRVVITVGGLVVLVLGGAIAALVAGWNGTPLLLDMAAATQQTARFEAGLLGLLGLALGAYMLSAAWQREDLGGDIRLEADGGDIFISLKAIESVVFEAAAEVEGVQEVSARLLAREGELLLDVAVHVSSERAMPEVAQDVQQQVGARVQQVAGVPVGRLNVRVRDISKPRRQRVG